MFSSRVMLAALALSAAHCSRRTDSTDGAKGGRVVIQNKGSDTLMHIAQAWAEKYKSVNPNVSVAVSGGGSGTGISALINGTVDIANSSRMWGDKEMELAKSRGVTPKERIVGYDALAIFLHGSNPLSEVTVQQLERIYGEGGDAEKWSQLGVTVPGCPSDEIIRVGRQNNSGTYIYFKESVMRDKEYKLGTREMHGSKDVTDLVGKTPCAIGYSGIAYASPEVKLPCVRKDDAAPCVPPSVDTALDGSYTIARPLFMFTNGEPKPEAKAFMDWILSDEGQCLIYHKGYAPVRKLACPSAVSPAVATP